MASLSGNAFSGNKWHSPTSPRTLVALARLGMSPEGLEYDLHAQTHDIDHDLYSEERRGRVDAVNQMIEYIGKYGVTEEEGELYNLTLLVSANPLADEVIELCTRYNKPHTQETEQHRNEFNVEEHPPMNTPNKRERQEPSDSSRGLREYTQYPQVRSTSKVSTSQPLSFEDRIAQKRASISEERLRMISRAEAALQLHAKEMEAKLAHQQDRANRRYEAFERLLKEKEETRQSRLQKQHMSIQRRESAKKALAELDLNRATLLQYNLHVKELKRTRFLELREYEREQQKQKALLNSLYADVVRHRREELLAKKQEMAELAVEAKQKVFSLLDQQAVINACYHGLQTRDTLSSIVAKQANNSDATDEHFVMIERERSRGQGHINMLDSKTPSKRPHLSKSQQKDGRTCKDLSYIETIAPIRPVF